MAYGDMLNLRMGLKLPLIHFCGTHIRVLLNPINFVKIG